MVTAFRGAVWSVAAVALGAAALVASCSAGVDGYHLEGMSGTGGGTQSGGNGGDASVTGGSAGSGGATGGSSGSGGATGGSGNTTGGAGASGGVGATGGVPTGGTAGTGGAGGTGGTGGTTTVWPLTPVQIFFNTALTGVTAAAWDDSSKTFFLLQPGSNQFFQVDPTNLNGSRQAILSAARGFPPPTNQVAPHMIAVNGTSVFVVVDTTLYALDPATGATQKSFALSGSPNPNDLYGAHTATTLFIGNATGSAYVVGDSDTSVTTSSLSGVGYVATDGTNFGFRTINASSYYAHLSAPGSITLLTSPCNTGTYGQNTEQLSISGNTLAWLTTTAVNLVAHFATVTGSTCTDALQASFGSSGTPGPYPVGLLSDSYALVTSYQTVNSAQVRIVSPVFTALGPTTVNAGNGGDAFIVAFGSQPHYAVLVGDVPVLLTF